MGRDILNDIIINFETKKFINFFRSKTSDFAPSQERLFHYNDSSFANFKKLGEIGFLNSDQRLIIVSAEVTKSLSERSGKKAQYEKAKKILRELDRYETGIFIFHDKTDSFRFSLVYEQTLGTKRAFSNFRRFTYFVDINQTNKTFLKQIGDGDFSSLEKIKERFSVEKVTKDFYKDIANWYFWAVKNVVFPEDAEKDRNKRNSFAVIRLITRIIFIWFMKEKGLMPAYLFDKEKIKDFLKDLSKDESSYYKAILQNLFFATLNTPISKRGFRKEKGFHGRNEDFMNHNIYRYKKYFKDSDYILKLFKGIPFLNGGLFECLDKSIKKEGKSYHTRIDGFSDRKNNSLKVPNPLFFSEELEVDLNKDYGTKTKKYKTRGLINILKSYNFTIDENTPIDEEIALDPELLGRVFENLLASYNPETSTSARKATGSYYTPRMIVDYMVNESLKAYFKNRLAEVKDIDKKLADLLSYSEENHRFNNSEVNILIEAINELKIIDPAVGSGAFPMGILQKLVFVLSKLDPHNTKWKQKQIKAVEKNIPDDVLKKDLIEKIEANFKNNELDYGRKLYLIQNCIYGIDIQPIAIQICKLRFFISLLVDEKSNDSEKKNFGIEPLPNLETKFVSANSLIGLKKTGQLLLSTSDVIALEKELSEIRRKHFTASRRKEKENLREKDAEIRKKLTKLLEGSIFSSETSTKIASWDPYGQNASADFFDPEWMFGVKAFDIVIANPPYVEHKKLKAVSELLRKIYITYSGTADLYVYFYELGIDLLKNKGVLTYISSNKFIRTSYGEKLRGLLSTLAIQQLIDFTKVQVFDALVASCVLVVVKNQHSKKIHVTDVDDTFINQLSLADYIEKNHRNISSENLNSNIWQLEDDNKLEVKEKIELGSKNLNKIKRVYISRGITTGYNPAFVIDENIKNKLIKADNVNSKIIKPLLQGRNIRKWFYIESNKFLLQTGFDRNIESDFPSLYTHLANYKKWLKKRSDQGKKWWNLRACKYYNNFEDEKIIWGLTAHKWAFAYDNEKHYLPSNGYILTSESVLSIKYLLALLNSNLLKFYFGFIGIMTAGGAYTLKHETISALPVKEISEDKQKPFIEKVDKILAITKSDDYFENQSKQQKVKEYEKQIDQMVYKLYGLTPGEIGIVEGKK